MCFIVDFIIVILVIFRPMAVANALKVATTGLPDTVILLIMWLLLTTLTSYVIFKMGGIKK